MELAIVCGARPNFIKVAPIMRSVDKMAGGRISYTLIYAGVENDPTIENGLFQALEVRRPDVYLGADNENLNELTGQVMAKFENYLSENPTDAVIVVDDLASTMAAAIVTKKKGILLAHIAAGTRSFDITMPKEINRLVIDGLSDILFTAGVSNNSIANKEGAELSKVYMVGNILIDNLRFIKEKNYGDSGREVKEKIAGWIGTDVVKPYIVFTLNRKALISDEDKLFGLISQLAFMAGEVPVIAPLRKDAADAVSCMTADRKLDMHNFHVVDPMDYLEFACLTANAAGIVTDSCNVAEEATFNQVPCITLNSYTEHIETVKVGTNTLVGEDPEKLAEAVRDMVEGKWKQGGIPDRWDGRSAGRILQILIEQK